MGLEQAFKNIKTEPVKRKQVVSISTHQDHEIARKIRGRCLPDMHYSPLYSAIGKLVSVDGISHDSLRENADVFTPYISADSDSMAAKSVIDLIDDHEGRYSDQLGIHAPAMAPAQESTEKYKLKFLESRMDQNKDYPLPEPVINLVQNGKVVPLLTKKSFSLWQGKQKSKKTTLLALAVAAFISGRTEDVGIYFSGCLDGVVLFFDNEQGESYAARTMKLILKLAGLPSSDRLVYCDLRQFGPTERLKIIEAGIQCTENVRMVVIDGVVDLMTDFMEAAEGHMTITSIIRLCSAYDLHVAGVLHQNKNDKNARAHVGTISSQKCEIEISTEVDNNDRSQSLVTCVNSRGIPFESFAIRWDKGCLPCIAQDWSTSTRTDEKASKKIEEARGVAKAVFKPMAALRNVDAIQGLMMATKKSEPTAKRLLNDLMGWQIVAKGNDGLYRINNSSGSRGHEGSKEGS